MTREISTLQGLLDTLATDGQAPLIFVAGDTAISPGYHVTELRFARVDAIDCGQNQSTWDEAQIQLLDGSDAANAHMSVDKFSKIAQASIQAIPGLGDASLVVEFAPGNAAFQRFSPISVESRQDGIYIGLHAHHAVCKPAVRPKVDPGRVETIVQSACCQPSGSASSACCA